MSPRPTIVAQPNSAFDASSGRDVLRPQPAIAQVAFGSVVLGACAEGELGGDLVDVYDLDARFGLIVVADISGKGAPAAAHAAFIRYTIRTLAIESDGDPAAIVAKFNAIYCRTVDDFESFVVLIVGIIDSQTGEVRYASAGHEPAFVRANGTVRMLAPTGPIVGVNPFSAYRTESFVLGRGDMLVWTTDGLTESRDDRRSLLGAEGLAGWIAAGPLDVDGMAAGLIASLAQRSGARCADDVAVLAVTCDAAPGRAALRFEPDFCLQALLSDPVR